MLIQASAEVIRCLLQLSIPTTCIELQQLAETEVELRVTLSYYVEPNPGERGWLRRHRYASHGLRFAVKRSLESVDAFRQRINAAAAAEEEGFEASDTGPDNWLLGSRVRDVGSIHSDFWQGTAVDLTTLCDWGLSDRWLVERESRTSALRTFG